VQKEFPHDLLAEKSLVGCLIIEGTAFDEISDLKIRRDDFYDSRYGMVFEAISDLAAGNKPIDYVTVCSRLGERGFLEPVGGQQFVTSILEDMASSANIYHYATTVKEKSSLRRILKTAMQVYEQGMAHTGDVREYLQEVEGKFFELTNEAKTGGMGKLNAFLKVNLLELEDTSRQAGQVQGLPTGYHQLDGILLGMQPGQLIILAARPAMGKTSLALKYCRQCLRHDRIACRYFFPRNVGQ
jgi:replicative DNA helicase